MKELDLHGIKHDDVKQEVIRFIEQNWDDGSLHDEDIEDEALEIVTGHSQPMRQMVIDILEEYELNYRVGDFLGVNTGFVRVEPF